MKAKDVIALSRRRLDDNVGQSSSLFWEDEDLVAYLNESIAEFCVATQLIRDSNTDIDADSIPLCRIPLVSGTYLYPLSAKIIGIGSVKILKQVQGQSDFYTRDLDMRDETMLDREQGTQWRSLTSDLPKIFDPKSTTGKIRFVPTPTFSTGTYTAILSVQRLPLNRLDIGDLDVNIELPEMFHDGLYKGVLSKAYGKPDSESFDKVLKQTFTAEWEQFMERSRRLLNKTLNASQIIPIRDEFR